jgi:hypothetical protein
MAGKTAQELLYKAYNAARGNPALDEFREYVTTPHLLDAEATATAQKAITNFVKEHPDFSDEERNALTTHFSEVNALPGKLSGATSVVHQEASTATTTPEIKPTDIPVIKPQDIAETIQHFELTAGHDLLAKTLNSATHNHPNYIKAKAAVDEAIKIHKAYDSKEVIAARSELENVKTRLKTLFASPQTLTEEGLYELRKVEGITAEHLFNAAFYMKARGPATEVAPAIEKNIASAAVNPEHEPYLPAAADKPASVSSVVGADGEQIIDHGKGAIEQSAVGKNYKAYQTEDTATLIRKLAEEHKPKFSNIFSKKLNPNEHQMKIDRFYESDGALSLAKDLLHIPKDADAAHYAANKKTLAKAMKTMVNGASIADNQSIADDELSLINGLRKAPMEVGKESRLLPHLTHEDFDKIGKEFRRSDVAHHGNFRAIASNLSVNAQSATAAIEARTKKTAQWWPSKEDWRGLWPFGKKNSVAANPELNALQATETNWISENKGKAALIGAGVIAAGGWVAHTMKSDKPEQRNR